LEDPAEKGVVGISKVFHGCRCCISQGSLEEQHQLDVWIIYYLFIHSFVYFLVQGMEPKALRMAGKHSITELHP
jgi:hypothetical protein